MKMKMGKSEMLFIAIWEILLSNNFCSEKNRVWIEKITKTIIWKFSRQILVVAVSSIWSNALELYFKLKFLFALMIRLWKDLDSFNWTISKKLLKDHCPRCCCCYCCWCCCWCCCCWMLLVPKGRAWISKTTSVFN